MPRKHSLHAVDGAAVVHPGVRQASRFKIVSVAAVFSTQPQSGAVLQPHEVAVICPAFETEHALPTLETMSSGHTGAPPSSELFTIDMMLASLCD